MKKILTIFLLSVTIIASAQNMQVQNMLNYTRSKELDKAKAAADAAAIHESTKGSAKMWMYRGNVYKAIYSDTSAKARNLDLEAPEKALEAYITCYKLDKDQVYKDEMSGSFIQSSAVVNRKAGFYIQNKQFDNALKCFDLLESALPYDFDQSLKRNNITKEKLMFNKFEMYKFAANKEKTKEYANKLIDIKYKDPKIYTDMVRLSMLDKDTAQALSYIEKGKVLFEDNMDLITSELDIYLARKKTDALKEKLNKAIEVSPDNEVLHFVLANLYRGTNNTAEAEKEYLKCISIKQDYEPANYNLAVMYYTSAKEWNDKLNALPMKDPKTKEYEAKSNEYFKKSIGYFESSFEITKDKRTKQILRQICLRTGETEKAEKYK